VDGFGWVRRSKTNRSPVKEGMIRGGVGGNPFVKEGCERPSWFPFVGQVTQFSPGFGVMLCLQQQVFPAQHFIAQAAVTWVEGVARLGAVNGSRAQNKTPNKRKVFLMNMLTKLMPPPWKCNAPHDYRWLDPKVTDRTLLPLEDDLGHSRNWCEGLR